MKSDDFRPDAVKGLPPGILAILSNMKTQMQKRKVRRSKAKVCRPTSQQMKVSRTTTQPPFAGRSAQ